MQQSRPQRSNSKPWDERVGPDASITNVSRGKRQMAETRDKHTSNLPLPPKDSPFLVEMPKKFSTEPVIVDSDLHLWRAYRSVAKGDDSRIEGKKMVHSHVKPVSEVQNDLRRGLRDRLRMQEVKELALKEEHMRAREAMARRHTERSALEDTVWRQRADAKGFEGLKRANLQQPQPTLPPIDDRAVDELRASLDPSMLHRSGGKRMVVNAHPSQFDNGPLFGGRDVKYGDALHQRWKDKTFT